MYDTRSSFYWRNFEATHNEFVISCPDLWLRVAVDIYIWYKWLRNLQLRGVKVGIVILKNKGTMNSLQLKGGYFSQILRPTYSDITLPINGPTIVVQLVVEGVRSWRVLFLILQNLVEILVCPPKEYLALVSVNVIIST